MIREKSMIDLSRKFGTEAVTVIPNFLEAGVASRVFGDFNKLTDRNLWFQAHYGQPDFFNPRTTSASDGRYASYCFGKYPLGVGSAAEISNLDSTRFDVSKIKNFKGDLLKAELGSKAHVLQLSNYLNSRKFVKKLSDATGISLENRAANLSLTRYGRSDFCSSHTDLWADRKITFLLHLTKNWMPHWGGQLAILNDDHTQILRTISPSFNSLIIFKVPLSHCVMPVAGHCPVFRYTLGGWYHGAS